jgi:hypothetical protein
MRDALASILGISLAASAVFVLIGLLIYLTYCRASHPDRGSSRASYRVAVRKAPEPPHDVVMSLGMRKDWLSEAPAQKTCSLQNLPR